MWLIDLEARVELGRQYYGCGGPARGYSGLDEGSHGRRNEKEWESGYIMKGELMGLADGTTEIQQSRRIIKCLVWQQGKWWYQVTNVEKG